MPNVDDTEYQDEEANELDEDGYALELAVLSVIASRLGEVEESTTYADAMVWASEDIAKIEGLLSDGAGIISKAADGIFDRMAEANDEWAAKFYEKAGVEQVKTADNPFMSEILASAKKQMGKNAAALCNTSVVSIIDANGNATPIRDAYTSIIDDAITAIKSGEQTYQQAIAKAVDRLASGGLRVQYASGVTRDLHTAVRTNIMDGYRDTMVKLREQQGKEYGADGVEVSAHSQCAPDHQDIQGRQFTNEEFERLQDSLDRPIGGANCRHTVFSVIVGVSTKSYTSKELAEIKRQSNAKVTITGLDGKERTMTEYEATQYQRRLETMIRKQRGAKELCREVQASDTSKPYTHKQLSAMGRGKLEEEARRVAIGKAKSQGITEKEAERRFELLKDANSDAQLRKYIHDNGGSPQSASEVAKEKEKQADARINKLTAEYKRISKEAGLSTRMERTKAHKLK